MKDAMYGAVIGLCSLMAFVWGWGEHGDILRNEAVKLGHAEYYLDAKHEKKWRWLPVNKEAQP